MRDKTRLHIQFDIQTVRNRSSRFFSKVFPSFIQFVPIFISKTLPSWSSDETVGSRIKGTGNVHCILNVILDWFGRLELGLRTLSGFSLTERIAHYVPTTPVLENVPFVVHYPPHVPQSFAVSSQCFSLMTCTSCAMNTFGTGFLVRKWLLFPGTLSIHLRLHHTFANFFIAQEKEKQAQNVFCNITAQ